MKIIFNNSTLQFNHSDYNWEQISVDSSMFTKNMGILVGQKDPNSQYYGCATLATGYSCALTGVNNYIDVSNYKVLKFSIICNRPLDQYTPGFCLYDDYIDVTFTTGNTVRNHIVASGCYYEDNKDVKEIIVEVPATAKALRFSLPKDWIDTNPINVYGVLRDNS